MTRHRLLLIALLLITMLLPCAAFAQQQRKVGTIGPPPRQKPQRQNSGESVPPLPLPATPLRRSEPKAEPKPPLFVAKLLYGTWQDYMPNPGDLDNLLRHVRSQLDAWYGQQVLNLDQVVALHEANKPVDIPVLYITGYQQFALTAKQREALRQYLLDGGTLIADATLGSPVFGESFAKEMTTMFPRRPMRPLQLDHPLYRSYYKINELAYFPVEQGPDAAQDSPPQLLGLNLAARTAVIFSPYDLSCGWDQFYAPPSKARVPDAPRSKATMPQDAIQLGVNMITYAAAQRRFAKAQAETRHLVGEPDQPRAALTIGHLRHHGDWNPDPNAMSQWIRLAAQRTTAPVRFDFKPVDPSLEQLVETPIVVMTGMAEPKLEDSDVAALRRHLQAGGFLFINNTSGFAKFDREARELIGRLFPDSEVQRLAADHPLLTGMFHVETGVDTASQQQVPVQLDAIVVDGRAVLVYSPRDALAMLKGIHDPFAHAYDVQTARKLSLNILTYALRQDR